MKASLNKWSLKNNHTVHDPQGNDGEVEACECSTMRPKGAMKRLGVVERLADRLARSRGSKVENSLDYLPTSRPLLVTLWHLTQFVRSTAHRSPSAVRQIWGTRYQSCTEPQT